MFDSVRLVGQSFFLPSESSLRLESSNTWGAPRWKRAGVLQQEARVATPCHLHPLGMAPRPICTFHAPPMLSPGTTALGIWLMKGSKGNTLSKHLGQKVCPADVQQYSSHMAPQRHFRISAEDVCQKIFALWLLHLC